MVQRRGKEVIILTRVRIEFNLEDVDRLVIVGKFNVTVTKEESELGSLTLYGLQRWIKEEENQYQY